MKYILLMLMLTSSAFGADLVDIERPNYGVYRSCENLVDCTPDRNCSAIVVRKDTRNCRSCLLKNPFGGCIQRGNDPICEASKAAQNASYKADEAARRLDCERLKSQSKAICEIKKETDRVECLSIRDSEAIKSKQVEVKYDSLLRLSKNSDGLNLSKNLSSYLKSYLSLDEEIDVRFYQYTYGSSLYLKAYKFFNPTRYVNKSDLVKILGSDLSKLNSVNDITFVDLDYYLKVEDVIKAIFTNMIFEKYGTSGVATLVASKGISLNTIVDDLVIEVCERMETSKSDYKCNSKAELYL